MASRDYQYHIGAKDDFSSISARIAAAAKRDMGKVSEALDDADNRGKKFARSAAQWADNASEEMERTAQAAEALGAALGDELKAKIGDAGIDKFIGDMRRAGVEFDDIEAEADELAAALMKIDEVSSRAGDSTADGFRKVGQAADHASERTDNTRSVVANFAGNAAQELPGVAGAFGPLNMAISQAVEYATEGNIAFGKLAAAAAPVAIIAVGMKGLADNAARAAAANKLVAEQVDGVVDRMRDGATATAALAAEMEAAGKVEFAFRDWGTQDATSQLAALGMTARQFTEIAGSGKQGIDEWAAAMIAAGADADTVQGIVIAATAEMDVLAEAERTAAVQAKVFGDSAQEVAVKAQAMAAAASAMALAHDSAGGAADRQARANKGLSASADEVAAATQRQHDAILGLVSSDLAAQQALVAIGRAMESYNAVMADGAATDLDRQDAQNNLLAAILANAEAQGQAAADAAVAAGDTAHAERDAAAARIASLQSVADQLDGPMRDAVLRQIGAINSVPTSHTTQFNADDSNLQRKISAAEIAINRLKLLAASISISTSLAGAGKQSATYDPATAGGLTGGATYSGAEQTVTFKLTDQAGRIFADIIRQHDEGLQ